jgi:hypothetical protein
MAVSFEPSCARGIVLRLRGFGVIIAVNFYDQLGFHTIKISDETRDGMLAANFVAKSTISHGRPNFSLCRCERMAQITGALQNDRISSMAGFVWHCLFLSWFFSFIPVPSPAGRRGFF